MCFAMKICGLMTVYYSDSPFTSTLFIVLEGLDEEAIGRDSKLFFKEEFCSTSFKE